MTQWRIDPNGVQGVVNLVHVLHGELLAEISENDAVTLQEATSWGSWVTAPVQGALAGLFEEQQANLLLIGRRVDAGLLGTVNAVLAYASGQEEMAAEFNREMLESARDGDFSYFEQHGYFGPDGQA